MWQYKHDPNPTFIIDIDENTLENTLEKYARMIAFIEDECEPIGAKVVATIPTRNGYHFITKPFNIQKFKERYPDIDVHKNNPTILYIPFTCFGKEKN